LAGPAQAIAGAAQAVVDLPSLADLQRVGVVPGPTGASYIDTATGKEISLTEVRQRLTQATE
jgi:hypothetical protein